MDTDGEADRERLRQRMDDLLRDARALRALIDEASHVDTARSERKSSGSPDPTGHAPTDRPVRG